MFCSKIEISFPWQTPRFLPTGHQNQLRNIIPDNKSDNYLLLFFLALSLFPIDTNVWARELAGSLHPNHGAVRTAKKNPQRRREGEGEEEDQGLVEWSSSSFVARGPRPSLTSPFILFSLDAERKPSCRCVVFAEPLTPALSEEAEKGDTIADKSRDMVAGVRPKMGRKG